MDKAVLVWMILAIIWGTTWIFIKLGLRDLPPVTFAGIRFLIADLILWGVVIARGKGLRLGLRDWGLIAWTGLIAFGFNYGLIFWGETRISSGLAAVLQAMISVFGLIIAHYYLPSERIDVRRISGVLISIFGVGFIFYDQLSFDGESALWGSAALLASSLCVAYANVIIKRSCGHIDSSLLAAGQMIFGFGPLLLAGTVWEGNPLALRWTALSVVSLLYLALVGSAIAFHLYYWLVRRIDVTKTMLISLVTPVVALLIGNLVLDERVTWRIAAGSAAILAGIGMIMLRNSNLKIVPGRTRL